MPMNCLSRSCDDRFLLDEIERAPVRSGGRAENEQMRAGIVGDDLRGAGTDEIREPRIRNLDRRMKRADRVENFLHGVRQTMRGGRSAAMRKANSGSPTRISFPAIGAVPPSAISVSARMRPAIGPSTLMCFCPASLVAAIFQPNRFPARIIFDRRLDRIAFRAVARTLRGVEAGEFGAGAPMIVQGS